jgi:hypothetical protein
MASKKNAAKPAAAETPFNNIVALVASLKDLQQQVLREYTPIVQNIIESHCRDVQKIEHTLDFVLDCAGQPEGLLLYKSLCRYYYGIDPHAAASYVYAYRDWYEPDNVVENSRGVNYGE